MFACAFVTACGGSSRSAGPPIGVTVGGHGAKPDDAPHATTKGVPPGETAGARAERLHRQAIIVDGHNDIPTIMFGSNVDLKTPETRTHTDLARMKAGGITGEFFSIYVEGDLADKPTVTGGGSLRRAIDLVDVTYRQVEQNPSELLLATTAADIRRAKKEGKIAVLMGIEGGHAIENSLYALRSLYRLGCRYMTLTHTNTNEWADSAGFSGPTPTRHHGLTPFGEEVVAEMQRIGMLVDVSHIADDTFWAVMKSAKAPVIASHSSARAVAEHRRNLNDDMLRALAKNGGVVMVNFWSTFISVDYQNAARAWYDKNGKAFAEIRTKYKDDPLGFIEARAKLRAETEPLPKVPLSVLIDHIEHIVQVAGIDHVGLGSDFDGVDALPDGLDGIDSLPKITLALVERGYKDDEILKILGGNFLRVFEQAEAYAKSTGTTLSGNGSTRRIDSKR
ncbi:putative dipeptidase [Labilithrix luteola]|uniref:Putative dipeptidase n=1 Tax=Labilithrix luteola TaxID=1391654 RepID=A0A0K1PKU5_9BACT|nr:putative dipeptidase [Labilithrix luteola]